MKMKGYLAELMVDNMEESIKFYTDILNFEVKISVPEEKPIFVSIANGGVEIMLYARNEFVNEIPKLKDKAIGGSFALYIEVEDVKEMYDALKTRV